MNERKDRLTDGQSKEKTNERRKKGTNNRMNGRTDGRTDGRRNEWMYKQTNERVNEQTSKWTKERIYERPNENRINGKRNNLLWKIYTGKPMLLKAAKNEQWYSIQIFNTVEEYTYPKNQTQMGKRSWTVNNPDSEEHLVVTQGCPGQILQIINSLETSKNI